MICRVCGHQNKPHAKKCSKCGETFGRQAIPPVLQHLTILAVAIGTISLVILIVPLLYVLMTSRNTVTCRDYTTAATTEAVHVHTWTDATCSLPKTCTSCGEAIGSPLGHQWVDATASAPKTCVRCKMTSGEPLKAPAKNTLMADPLPSGDDGSTSAPAFGNRVTRDEISAIRFLNSTEGAPTSSQDVSQARNNSVLAWTEPAAENTYTLFIAADGGVYAPKNCAYLFANYRNLYEIEFNNAFFSSDTITMEGMFSGCVLLNTVDLSELDTSNVTNMSGMFNWTGFQTLDLSGFDTSSVVDMSGMFTGCRNMTSLNVCSWDTSKVTNMKEMFCDCRCLTQLDIRQWDTSSVTNMNNMFEYCWKLGSLDVSSMDTSSVTDMNGMFCRCASLTELDLRGFDTSSVRDMSWMFKECAALKTVDLSSFDTSNVVYMMGMFQLCESLESLDLSSFDTSNVETMAGMFSGCRSLTQLDISSFDMSNVKDTENMFHDCIPTDLKLPAGRVMS